MSRAVRTKNDHQQAVVKMMNRLSQRHSSWEVWNDFVVMIAEAIANCLGGEYRDRRSPARDADQSGIKNAGA